MAVQEQTPLREYTANGVTTSFALGFDCEETNHLIVTIDDVEVLPTDWYLSGSNVVFWTAPGNGKLIKLQRNTPFNRLADYQSYNNSFRPPAINKDFDRIWWKLQELGVADWILHNRIDALKAYVDDRDDELRAYLMEEIRKQGVALDQLDEYYNYLMQRLAQIAVDKGWDASFVVDGDKTQHEINQNQNLFNDKYNKFKQPEVGAVEQDLSIRSRKKQYITDFSNAQQAFDVKRNAASYVYIPNGQYNIEGSLNLAGPHFIEGQGDYSILAFSGENNGIVTAAGSKYDDHAKRTIQNLRIDGDRPSGTATHGTTRGLYVSNHGHAGEVKGVTFNGHDVGYYLGLNYTSRGCYNMYRANRIGLHLHSVTSYREESIYARYNTEAAILITGSNQNITIAGGAIEGNSGRAIWARDLVVNSNVQIILDDVYLEVNGNEALGIPSVELQEIEKMEVIINGGSYWYNLNNGVYSGPYMWGNSVSFHGSSLQGYHYAKKISLNNVLQAPIMNTTKGLALARAFGLREPAIVSVFTPQTFSPTVFQIPFVTGKPTKIIGYTNNAIQTYPFSSLSSGVTRSEDTANDYGDGKLEKLAFSDTGNYNLTYATLFTTSHAVNDMSVYVFALIPETDCEIGLIAADSATRDISYFKLKAGVKYKFVRTFKGLEGTTERLRMFSINGACTVSFKPIAVYQFNDNDTSNAFIKSLSMPAENFSPAANQADSVATDVAGLKADFNALLAKLKASGQMQ